MKFLATVIRKILPLFTKCRKSEGRSSFVVLMISSVSGEFRYQFLVTVLVMQLINVGLELVRAVQNRDIDLDIKCPPTNRLQYS